MSVEVERTPLEAVPWDDLDAMADRTVMQTRGWLAFLAETQGVEPVVAEVTDDGHQVGWFTGAIARRVGLKLVGSPLQGWTTAAVGCNLAPGTDRVRVLAGVRRFAFSQLGAVHLEFADRALTELDAVPAGFEVSHLPGYELDLRRDDADLLAGMKRDGRYNIGLAERRGVTVEEVDPLAPGPFVETYYRQVCEAFAKRGLQPSYPPERVDALLRHLGPSGNLLVLQARAGDGEVAATGIFPGLAGGTAEYWMGAGARAHQRDKANEALMWHALRTWRDRGAHRMNFGGGGDYKAKYGGEPHVLPHLRASRFAIVERARALALDRRRRARAAARARARR